MKNLRQIITKAESYINYCDVKNESISNTTVAWHLEHTFLVINTVINALTHCNETDYKWAFNIKRSLIFLFKKIPRGKVKAPKAVEPTYEINEESLTKHVQKIRGKLQLLEEMSDKKFFAHPFLGHLNRKKTIKFLEIHTKHHLKIIEAILGK